MLYSKWIQTPISTRLKIADIFGFKKIRHTHVANNIVVDDGFNVKDIEEALTIHKMQDFLNNPETDAGKLFTLLVDTLEGKTPLVTNVIPENIAVPVDKDSEEYHTNTMTYTDSDGKEHTVKSTLGYKPKTNAKTKKSKQK